MDSEPIPRAALEYAITRLARNMESYTNRPLIQNDLDFIFSILKHAGFTVNVPKDGLATIRRCEEETK